MPRLADFRRSLAKAARLSPLVWRDVAHAAIELALARVRHGRTDVRQLISPGSAGPLPLLSPSDRTIVERIAFAVPRTARWLPFRTDCMIQALAAQRWLERRSIATRLIVGVRKQADALDAHAWLDAGGRIVTGGDISGYQNFSPPRA